MGHLLKKAHNDEMRGLIGITNSDEEVLLSDVSRAKHLVHRYAQQDDGNMTDFNQRMNDLVEKADEDVYILQGTTETFNQGTLMVRSYNEFKKRE